MERYKELEKRLEDILEHLDEQLSELNSNTDKNFHNNLINLISEYPNFKEVIQFVVSINDKQETKNEIFKDVIYDSIKDIVHVKQQAVLELIKELHKLEEFKSHTHVPENINTPIASGAIQYLKQLITPKILLISGAVVLVCVLLFIMPDQVIALAKVIFAKGI